jgi:crotonobetainyl-CoA:carnitine CoA-transferase CaiB-like acyl-CoA transferase
MPELVDDARFKTQLDRAKHQVELAAILERKFALQDAAFWIAEMDRRGVPCAPINSYGDILNDPHVQAMGLVQPLHLPNGVTTRTVVFPVSMSDCDLGIYRDPPKLGEHNDEVMREWLA